MKKIFRITILSLAVCGLLAAPALAKEKQIRMAPLNPAFKEYMKEVKAGRQPSLFTEEGHALGLIPSPIDMSHTRGYHPPLGYRRVFLAPATYDLRPSLVTPVKDQGACGSCWAFATYGSLESWLLVDPGETWDFSENNLKDCHGFGVIIGTCTTGGNHWMSTAYLARWSGPIDEADDPYVDSNLPCTTGLRAKKHLETVLMVPDRADSLDNDNIKNAVMDYGAMYTSMYYNASYYNSSDHTYYYDGSPVCDYGWGPEPCWSNHAVAIVGWDDDFDKTLFTPAAPDNGAWIVRNSWGVTWGDSGYFYVSYYDANIGTDNASFINAWDPDLTGGIEQYDPLGNVANLGYVGSHTAWGANIFTPPTDETLKSVGFYTRDANASYEIYIYDTFSGGSFSDLLGSKSGPLTYPGYYTIDLDATILRNAGDEFAIVIKFTTPTYDFPIPVERPISGYSDAATANLGESYVSSDGTTWTDITTVPLPNYNNANVCIKGIMTDVQPLAPVLVEIPSPNYTGNYNVVWSGVTGATAYELQERSTGAWATISDTLTETYYLLTGKGSGTYDYRVRTQVFVPWSDWSNVEGVNVTAPASSGKSGNRCLIATAAYSGYTKPHELVRTSRMQNDTRNYTNYRSFTPLEGEASLMGPITVLQNFRDEWLLTNPLGQAFVRFYYQHSPRIADFIRNKESLKAAVRTYLKPVVWLVKRGQIE